jgi:hypothetical protein
MSDDSRKPELEIAGSWLVVPRIRIPRLSRWPVPRIRIPRFVWIGVPLFAAWLLCLIFLSGRNFPPDPRFYGTWDVFTGSPESRERCCEWSFSAPTPLATRMYEGKSTWGRHWGVKDGFIYVGLGGSHNGRPSFEYYEIKEATDDRVVLIAKHWTIPSRLELRRQR